MTTLEQYYEKHFFHEPVRAQGELFGGEPRQPAGYRRPPYFWRLIYLRYSGQCWYCGGDVDRGQYGYFSFKFRLLCHRDCRLDP